MPDRPTPGELEQRSTPAEQALAVDGRRVRGVIPYGTESRDLGGWRERMAAGCLREADTSDLVLTVDHAGVPLGRFPTTLEVEDRTDGLHWSASLPESRADIREAVERGDLRASSWRMVVGRDSWEGNLRTVEEVRSLRDVAIVTAPAYPAATAELRHEPDPAPEEAPPNTEPPEAPVPEENPAGALQVEDRAATDTTPDIEARVLDALASVRKGECRSLTLTSADPIAPPELSGYLWDRIRPNSVAIASGIRRVTTDRSEVAWPAITADMTAAWVAEAAVIPATDPTFATLTARPSKLAARCVFSNEVADDSEPSAVGVLTDHIGRIMAAKLDIGVFEGSGADPEIGGLATTAGIQTITTLGANGATPADLDFLADAIAALEAESIPGPYVAVMHPRTWATVRKLKEATGSIKPLMADPPSLDAPRQVLGVPVYLSAALSVTETRGSSSNASSVWVYSVAPSVSPVLVDRQGVDAATVELDRSRLFDSDQSELRGKVRVDMLVPYPKAVARVVGARP